VLLLFGAACLGGVRAWLGLCISLHSSAARPATDNMCSADSGLSACVCSVQAVLSGDARTLAGLLSRRGGCTVTSLHSCCRTVDGGGGRALGCEMHLWRPLLACAPAGVPFAFAGWWDHGAAQLLYLAMVRRS
jgi:hypothetical protein